jgi:hypothetical protein
MRTQRYHRVTPRPVKSGTYCLANKGNATKANPKTKQQPTVRKCHVIPKIESHIDQPMMTMKDQPMMKMKEKPVV